jgi:hypothetical protein
MTKKKMKNVRFLEAYLWADLRRTRYLAVTLRLQIGMLLRQEPYLRRGIQLSASPSHGCLQTWHMRKDQYGIIEARNVSLDSKARKLERSLWWRNAKCDRRQGDERDGRSLRRAVYAAHSPTLTLARISTAHFQHQTVDISRVTEIRSRRLPVSYTPIRLLLTHHNHEADFAVRTRACAHAGQIQRRWRHHLLRLKGSRCVRVVLVDDYTSRL